MVRVNMDYVATLKAYTNWSLLLGGATQLTVSTDTVATAYREYYSVGGLNTATPLATLTASVHNTGQRTSDVVVLAFAVRTTALPPGSLAPPLRQLVGFARAADLTPGETRPVPLALTPLAMCRVDNDGNQWAEPSSWRLDVTVDGMAGGRCCA
jgi:hypothetical protein